MQFNLLNCENQKNLNIVKKLKHIKQVGLIDFGIHLMMKNDSTIQNDI